MIFKGPRPKSLAGGAVIGLAIMSICAGANAGDPYQYVPGQVYNPTGKQQQAAMPQAATPSQESAPQQAPNTTYQQPPYPQPPNNVYLAGAAKGGLDTSAASTTVSRQELEQLPDRVTNLENLFKSMQNEIINSKAEAAAAKKEAAEARAAADSLPEVSTKGGLSVKSPDGDYSFKLFGRIMADSAWYQSDKSGLGDGTEIRRARIGVGGTMFHDWGYKLEVDFEGNEVGIKDAYVSWIGNKPFELLIGNSHEPVSLEMLNSSRFITFMERPMAVNAFAPERHIGIKGQYNADMWSASLGVFGGNITADPNNEGNERIDVAGRVTFDPVNNDMYLVHLGVSGYWSQPNAESVRFRDRPDSHVTDVRFIDTNNNFMNVNPGWLNNVSSYSVVDPELALTYGPATFQGEYFYVPVSQNDCLPMICPDVTLRGWYAQVSTFLTGEHRNYEADAAKFERVKPNNSMTSKSCCGAFEIGARLDNLNLDDGSEFQKGDETNLTLGLNWYATSHVRFMFNYIKVWNNASATGNSGNLFAGVTDPGYDDPDIFQVRAQVDW